MPVSFCPDELKTGELWQLLSPRQHPLLLSQRRATMIVNRVRLFAMLFAVLTPLWGIIDIMVFSPELWIQLAVLRLFTSLAFATLLVLYRPSSSLLDAYRAMAILFIIPTLFYIASRSLLSGHQLNDLSAAVATGYAFLPFVLMAGLAIFPLSLIENALLASILLVAQGLAGYLSWSTLNWPSFAGGFWLLILIAGVTALASVSQLALMITLVRQAIHDPLTGVFSRRSGEKILSMQWSAAQRSDSHFTLAFIDLDHFKNINDTYGHQIGDKVLCELVTIMQTRLRSVDYLARYGGEEFVIILPHTDADDAARLAERLRKAVAGHAFAGGSLEIPVTISVGLAPCPAEARLSSQELFHNADMAMYRAKHQGRNQVCRSCEQEADLAFA